MTFPAGSRILAENLAFLDTLLGAWTTYTPTWTASAGSPSIGNGTLAGRYLKIGRTFDLQITLTAGSTTTYGTGGAFWSFSLPASTTSTARFVGAAYNLNATVSEFAGTCSIDAGATTIQLYRADATADGRMTNTGPHTFGNADTLSLTIRYEATS